MKFNHYQGHAGVHTLAATLVFTVQMDCKVFHNTVSCVCLSPVKVELGANLLSHAQCEVHECQSLITLKSNKHADLFVNTYKPLKDWKSS